MSKRRMSQNKRFYNLKEVNVFEPNRRGLKAVMDIMDIYKIPYDCELYAVTSWIEKIYTKRQQEVYGIHLTSEVINCIKYIIENDLLKRGVE